MEKITSREMYLLELAVHQVLKDIPTDSRQRREWVKLQEKLKMIDVEQV